MTNTATDTPPTGRDACDPDPQSRPLASYLHRTAIVVPSRTGGGDHSARAVHLGVDPMVFGGRRYNHDALCAPRRHSVIRRIVQAGGWIARREWAYTAARVDTRAADLCLGMVTA